MRVRKNWFWGLLFIALGMVLLMSALNLTKVNLLNTFISLLFVGVLVDGLRRLEWFGIFFPLGMIYWLNASLIKQQFGIPEIGFWYITGISFLLAIGFSILFKKKHRHVDVNFDFGSSNKEYTNYSTKNDKDVYEGEYQEKVIYNDDDDDDDDDVRRTETSEDVFFYSARLNSSTKYVYSSQFRKAELQCSMADLKVFFDQATLSSEGADIILNCSLGSITLYIPKTWRVNDQITATLGDVKNSERSTAGINGPMVNIVGNVSLGDVKIIYV